MSSSFTRFHEHGFWSKDSPLEVWLRCLALNLDTDGYLPDHWLHAFRDNLLFASSGICHGWVSADLDEHLTDDDRVAKVVAASDRAILCLRAFGSEIPEDFLNALGAGSGNIQGGWPLAWFEDYHETFNALLLGHLDSDAASSRVLPLPVAE